MPSHMPRSRRSATPLAAAAVCAAIACMVSAPTRAAVAATVAAGAPAAAASREDGDSSARRAGETAAQLRRWIEMSAASTWSMRVPGDDADDTSAPDDSAGMRVEVRLGRLNPQLRLAACARIEPFLPPNARLWGRSYVGVRCAEGASWSMMVPVTVSVYGPALVADVPMPMGTVPDSRNFHVEEVDWTRSPAAPVSDPAMLSGRALGRPLSAGQVLRASDLRIPRVFSAGDPVRIRVIGNGFTVSTSGYAMAGAGEGESLRVRTDAGRMLVGTVRERAVEVKL